MVKHTANDQLALNEVSVIELNDRSEKSADDDQLESMCMLIMLYTYLNPLLLKYSF